MRKGWRPEPAQVPALFFSESEEPTVRPYTPTVVVHALLRPLPETTVVGEAMRPLTLARAQPPLMSEASERSPRASSRSQAPIAWGSDGRTAWR